MEESAEVEVIIGLKIGDKYLTLSEKSARELYLKLNKMFAEKEVAPVFPWYTPWVINKNSFQTYTFDSKTIPCEKSINTLYVGDFPESSYTTISNQNITLT